MTGPQRPATAVYRSGDGRLYRVDDMGPVFCAMFAACEELAVDVVRHPVLGGVPTCQRCKDKLA